MKMTPADMGMIVSIFAERPETLELMRRNIDSLEQAIANLGYEDVAFTFDSSSDGQSTSSEQDENGQLPLGSEAPGEPRSAAEQEVTVVQHIIDSGLDVRI